MVHDLWAMCDAIAYVVRNGVEWRAVPVDFPNWDSVYAFYERWSKRGLPQSLVTRLRERLWEIRGCKREPTACIIDSQMVKCADTVPKATSGYHGGKKISGRGRHIVVDTEGWLLALVVVAASASDKAGAKLLAERLEAMFSTLRLMWADACYNGKPLCDFILKTAGITLEIVKRTSLHTFQVIRRRWEIERTFGWLVLHRRLVLAPSMGDYLPRGPNALWPGYRQAIGECDVSHKRSQSVIKRDRWVFALEARLFGGCRRFACR